MTRRIGEPTEAMKRLQASAATGGKWYELGRSDRKVSITVVVDWGMGPTGFDGEIELLDDESALFWFDLAAEEGITPGSGSIKSGWVGWMGGDVVVGWQEPELDYQGTAEWKGRSPFSENDQEPFQDDEALARLAAALVMLPDGDSLRYLPERDDADQ